MGVDDFELAFRLTRLRLGVRRTLGVSVNLDALVADTDYRGRTLADIEQRTDDEGLLDTLLRVREALDLQTSHTPAAAVQEEGTKGGRDYRFGARSG